LPLTFTSIFIKKDKGIVVYKLKEDMMQGPREKGAFFFEILL
jgi:hypothetical protein